MPRSTRVVLVLHGDPAMQSVVASAARPQALVTGVSGWTALAEAIKETPPSTVSVVDPYFGTATPGPAAELRMLLERMPSSSVIAALTVDETRARDVATLDDWGVAGIISVGHDDTPAAIQQRLANACAHPIKRLLGNILPPEISPHAYALIFAAADTTCEGGAVADLSEALGASPSTLLRRTEEAGLPNPRTLLQWMRILIAAKLLQEPERDVDHVARATGYASTGELRRVTQRHIGVTPAQLRDRAAFHLAAQRFTEALSGSTVDNSRRA